MEWRSRPLSAFVAGVGGEAEHVAVDIASRATGPSPRAPQMTHYTQGPNTCFGVKLAVLRGLGQSTATVMSCDSTAWNGRFGSGIPVLMGVAHELVFRNAPRSSGSASPVRQSSRSHLCLAIPAIRFRSPSEKRVW